MFDKLQSSNDLWVDYMKKFVVAISMYNNNDLTIKFASFFAAAAELKCNF